MADPQIPRLDDAVGRGVEGLLAARPSVGNKVEVGRYGHVIAGWRAQLALLINRIADEVRSGRLPYAAGQGLRDLIASEFDTIINDAPTPAVGSIVLLRSLGSLGGGVIRKGTKFRRPADPTAQPVPKQEASYEAVLDIPLIQGATTVTVPLQASRAGSFANILLPVSGTSADIVLSDPLFDTNLQASTCSMGGGSDGFDDSALRRIAGAFARGRYAPTVSALLAGALLGTGVRFAIVREDTTLAIANVSVADQSWGSSDRLSLVVQQKINDVFLGFGCRVKVLKTPNIYIRVSATVTLRDPIFSTDTTPIDVAIRSALRDYFNLRPDWDIWKLSAVRAVISNADVRILTCTAATVSDAQSAAVYGEPTQATTGTHYYLPDQSVTVTYALPL